MSATELEASRRALQEKLGNIDATLTNQESRLANLDAVVGDVKSALQRVEEASYAANLASAERALTNDDRALREYTTPIESEVKRNPGAYHRTADGCVRLYGHTTPTGGYRWGVVDDPNATNEWQVELQRLVTRRNIVRAHVAATPGERGHAEKATPYCDELIQRHLALAPPEMRIFAKSAGAGSEWVPQANMFPEVERALEYMPGITDIFPRRSMPPVHSYVLPYADSGELRPYKGRVPTGDDPGNYTLSSITTEQNTITPYKIVVASQAFSDALEDAILPVVDEIMMRAVRAVALGRDDITINGDTAGTHQDTIASWNTRGLWGASGLGTTEDHRTSAIGLRARAFDISNTTDQNGVQTEAGFFTAVSKLGPEYYSRAGFGGVKAIVSPEYWLIKMFQFSSMTTWEKAGQAGTYLSGLLGGRKGPSPHSIGFLGGVEILMTPFITADLAATGKYTGSGSTTGMLMVAPEDFELRVRKGAQIDSTTDIRNDTTTWVLKVREMFRTKANDDVTSKKNVHWSFNLDAS